MQPAASVRELAGAGVARISTGSLLFRIALGAAAAAFADIRAGAFTPNAATPSYDEVARST